MSKKQMLMVGFMLFAMFFGAGNLIFPLALGFNAGDNFILAMLGFVITGVGLPLIGMIVGSLSSEGYRSILKEIHPLFGLVFLTAIYLTIGPFFAIPRTATTAYEIGIVPFIGKPDAMSLFLFSVVFFAATYFVAIKPNELSATIGKYLTPVLLISILFLVFRAFMMYKNNDPQQIVLDTYKSQPLATGFTEGYLTMDTLASIAFSIIAINSVKALGITDRKQIMHGTMVSSLIAAILLILIYSALGWAGNRVNIAGMSTNGQNLGAFLLVFISREGFGSFGMYLLSIIVFLACLTTSSGLIAAVSEYFNSIIPKISYRNFVNIFTIISLVLANQGLDQVIKTSVPILSILYPVAISVIFLIILKNLFAIPQLSLQLPIIIVTILSILTVLQRFKVISIPAVTTLPLFASQLEWIPFLIVGCLLGFIIAKIFHLEEAK